ncbi:hypothetical protein QBC33DRAFT_246797 [Phialemonium atrogriseum]|uniref:C2H2-type domain-containing protein n=1 Tax=Phialemonium atrogriseum TaxID=1093897 RepID=A0AAJ0BRY3_9PEZI|nr:uncharacterized protein QBC33DRAFT_246797 [Phialemonium atrogriseum]KAK1763374.1 hypothetical protein QBC33DRAFT_246797 [Phialemonium atrogriseum]
MANYISNRNFGGIFSQVSPDTNHSLQPYPPVLDPNLSTQLATNNTLIQPMDFMFSCNFCAQNFETDDDRRQHERIHLLPVACPLSYCDTRTKEKREMEHHLRSTHPVYAEEKGIPDESCVCPECGQDFTLKKNFDRHFKKQHPKPKAALSPEDG